MTSIAGVDVLTRATRTRPVAPGVVGRVLLLFAAALQSVFLAALLTFARAPWYPSYAATTQAWKLEPLADQQLAGAIMWVPVGFVYTTIALRLLVLWIRSAEHHESAG